MSNSEEINKSTKSVEAQAAATKELSYEQEANLRITRDINNEIRDGLKLIKKEADLKKSVRSALDGINKAAEFQSSIAGRTNAALLDTNNLLKQEQDLSKNLLSLEKNKTDLINKAKQQKSDFAAMSKSASEEEKKAAKDAISNTLKLARAVTDQVVNQKEGKKALDSQVSVSKQLSKLGSVKMFDSLKEIAGAIPGVKSLTGGFDAAAKASKKAAAEMVTIDEKTGKVSKLNIFQKSAAGLKGLKAGVGELMNSFGLVAIITKALKAMVEMDKSTGEIAKGMNQTYDNAKLTGAEFMRISKSSGNTLVNYKDIKHAQMDINKTLGTNVMMSDEMLATSAKLATAAGMSAEEQAGIVKLSVVNGKSLKKNTGEFMAQVRLGSLKNKVALNEKKLMSEMSKISASMSLSMGNSAVTMGKTVGIVKSLGMEMSQVDKISESLLNFESSIEKEMQAELMLGKELNLEKARSAALQNDFATVAEEIAKQAGSAADFSKMNRLEQQALAEAVGMGREELAQTLFTQEMLKNATGAEAEKRQALLDSLIEENGLKEAQKIMADTSFEDLQAQADEQTKMKQSAAEMNQLFLELGKSLQPAMKTMAKMMEFAAKNSKFIIAAVVGIKAYNAGAKIGLLLSKRKAASEKGAALMGAVDYSAQAGANAAKTPIPLVGVGLGIAAAAAAYLAISSLTSDAEKGDDVFSPSTGGGGYGSRTLLGPEGAIKLNNDDDIIAGTDLFNEKKSAGSGVSMDLSNMENSLAQTNLILNQILNSNGQITMDSEELGTAISLNNYEISA
tara:strand:- start:7009 stop:9381 length:2373 start_codon:yes stop_codon:yes gene_type:complete